MTKGEKFDAVWLTVIGVALVVGFIFAARRERVPQTVAISTPAPTPAQTPCPEATPGRPLDDAVDTLLSVRRPLTYVGPDGVLILRPKHRYDIVDADCARKLLAVIAREGWLDEPTPYEFATFRDARHSAAVKACPGFGR